MAGDRDGAGAEQREPLLGAPEAPPKRRSTLLTVCPFILGAPVSSCEPGTPAVRSVCSGAERAQGCQALQMQRQHVCLEHMQQ